MNPTLLEAADAVVEQAVLMGDLLPKGARYDIAADILNKRVEAYQLAAGPYREPGDGLAVRPLPDDMSDLTPTNPREARAWLSDLVRQLVAARGRLAAWELGEGVDDADEVKRLRGENYRLRAQMVAIHTLSEPDR